MFKKQFDPGPFSQIDEVKVGDLVLSFNEVTGENEYQPVLAVIHSEKQVELVVIELEFGSIIEATPEHLIFADGEWKQANELYEGMSLKKADGSEVKISKVSKIVRVEIVYDLTVKRNHNFYVSKDEVLVHNISLCEEAARALAKAVPKSCVGLHNCKQFVKAFEKLLMKRNVDGKRVCLQTKRLKGAIYSDTNKNIDENGGHQAVRVGDLVFDNMNSNGVPLTEWLKDLGGPVYISTDGDTEIRMWEEAMGSSKPCKYREW